MLVGSCKVKIRIPVSQSLKDKRNILKSTLRRIKNKFNVAAAEVEPNKQYKLAKIGLVTISSEAKHVERQLEEARKFIADNGEVQVLDWEMEFL